MGIAATEIGATLGALAILSTIVTCAGAAAAERLGFPGFAQASRLERIGLALLCGVGCLPVALDLAARLGAWPLTLAAVALAALGAPVLARTSAMRGRLHPAWIVAAILWILLSTALVVDMPDVGRLQHSLLAVDYVKHSAATWSLAEFGAPPPSPTFYEPGRAMSYYYLFYTLPAVVAKLGAPLGIAARHAAYACAPLMGFALFALASAILRRSGADAAAGAEKHPANWPLLALLLATGLDFIPLAIVYLGGGGDANFVFLHFIEWDEQVSSWFNSVMWVPHHIAALCAAFVGFMALTGPGRDPRRLALAALAFASMAGDSVYVAMTAALGAAFWLVSLLWRRRVGEATRLCLVGALALVVAAPWLVTLLPRLGAENGPAPIGFRLRGPEWIDIVAGSAEAGALYRGLSMPVFYLVDFGVFALGAWLFWRHAKRRGFATEMGVLLACLTAAALTIGSLLHSTILFNDLGWRSMLFAQLATLVWTTAAARQGLLFRGRIGYVAATSLTLGYLALFSAVAQIRLYFPHDYMRATLSDEMTAWSWLDAHLARGAVVQPSPYDGRAYGQGLYGRFPAPLADRHNARLFGASKAEIERRIDRVGPLFSDIALSYEEMTRRAAEFGVDALIVSSRDAVFAAPEAWTAKAKADYENPSFRIYLLTAPGHVARN